eukprot:2256504-Rhodomonas_salina.1
MCVQEENVEPPTPRASEAESTLYKPRSPQAAPPSLPPYLEAVSVLLCHVSTTDSDPSNSLVFD